MESKNNQINTPWMETETGKQVQTRLSDERTLQAIDHLLSRINTLEKAVEGLTTIIQQGPGMLAMSTDMADEFIRNSEAKGVNIEERLKNALHLADRLTEPALVEKIDPLISFANQVPGLLAMTADMVDESIRNADTRGVNIEQRLGVALQMAEKLTAPEMFEKMDGLLKLGEQMPGLIAMTTDIIDESLSKVTEKGFSPQVLLDVAGTANTALTNAKAEAPAKVGGLFGLLRVLKDPDRQKGLGFLMNFLKHFGRNI